MNRLDQMDQMGDILGGEKGRDWRKATPFDGARQPRGVSSQFAKQLAGNTNLQNYKYKFINSYKYKLTHFDGARGPRGVSSQFGKQLAWNTNLSIF